LEDFRTEIAASLQCPSVPHSEDANDIDAEDNHEDLDDDTGAFSPRTGPDATAAAREMW